MSSISKPLLQWFDQHGRHSLPWQASHSSPANIYHVWLSEIMLQQTQVSTVIDYFNNFIHHFPSLAILADASEDNVLAQWAGLGYYARARNLHKSAKIIMQDYQGVFPDNIEQVVALPGIGESTAGAILSISHNQNHAILDGNVKRVLSRYHQVKGHYGQAQTLKQLWVLAKQHTPNTRNNDYTQAIMDLGATLCTRSNPDCGRCPVQQGCQAYRHNTQTEYPNPKPKKNKPSRSIAMLIYQNKQGQIYLEKRPPKGIWGGLWSFVECEDSSQAIMRTIQQFDASAHINKMLKPIKHSFTHYHLIINPIIVDCLEQAHGFQSINQLKVGVPTPVNKILAQLD
ncbi:MAG TPA: A/G-specific adenine glycosylase [Gammaproteobacteria bacterium]|jgi:A/G-specific adenine glycosylase|nr:A/G-specific adenine glycosylase [Gammaproteobacteria bacterium]HAN33378.1 A/G-specific adenine glycosylase [Gammaproteobacteria bacterium]HAO44736.1 A/G-specific adenine glycosylase [Gammaproteobacteria bacterium]HAO53910.1 A/G-specific adenine glycosylase [Gammaproteobacteria bacterium]HAO70228.1 A/G-specific adenine glycosylase [Gammaproteobacteria bacterium]